MRAINDRVIIRAGCMMESLGGIVLASSTIDNGRLALNIGKVVSCGDGVTLRTGEVIPVKVKPGDVVVWEQFGAIRFEVLGPDVVCVRAEDIGAVLDEAEWKGRYLFEPEEVAAYKKRLEDEREAALRKRREAEQKNMDKTMVTFQCWEEICKTKGEKFERPRNDDKCRSCGSKMKEAGAPMLIIPGSSQGR